MMCIREYSGLTAEAIGDVEEEEIEEGVVTEAGIIGAITAA